MSVSVESSVVGEGTGVSLVAVDEPGGECKEVIDGGGREAESDIDGVSTSVESNCGDGSGVSPVVGDDSGEELEADGEMLARVLLHTLDVAINTSSMLSARAHLPASDDIPDLTLQGGRPWYSTGSAR